MVFFFIYIIKLLLITAANSEGECIKNILPLFGNH